MILQLPFIYKMKKMLYSIIIASIFFLLVNAHEGLADDEIDIMMRLIDAKIEKHIKLLDAENYRKAYEDYAERLKETTSLEEYRNLFSTIFDVTGKLLSRSLSERYFITDYDTRQITKLVVVYDAVFESVKGKLEAHFITDKDGSIKLARLEVITPPEFRLFEKIEKQSNGKVLFN